MCIVPGDPKDELTNTPKPTNREDWIDTIGLKPATKPDNRLENTTRTKNPYALASRVTSGERMMDIL